MTTRTLMITKRKLRLTSELMDFEESTGIKIRDIIFTRDAGGNITKISIEGDL